MTNEESENRSPREFHREPRIIDHDEISHEIDLGDDYFARDIDIDGKAITVQLEWINHPMTTEFEFELSDVDAIRLHDEIEEAFETDHE